MFSGSDKLFNYKKRTATLLMYTNVCASLYNTQQTTYKHKVTLYTLTRNTHFIYNTY